MKKSRILAVVMSVLMMISMLPAMVFAEPSGNLEGELKIKGEAKVDTTLKADYDKVKPEGLADEYVSFLWQREISESAEEPLVELSKEKTYKVTAEDLGYKIVLTITGLEEKGITGTLTAKSAVVTEADPQEEIPTEENQETASQGENQEVIPEESYENIPEEMNQEVVPEEEYQEVIPEESYEQIPEEENQEALLSEEWEETYEEYPESEEVSEELLPIAEPGTERTGETEEELVPVEAGSEEAVYQEEFVSYNAETTTADGSGVLDFGTIEKGTEDSVEAQFVTVKNTGTGELNFQGISPEHFMVQDITEPLQAGEEVSLWIQPRAGIEAGTYEDEIAYVSDELVSASFVAKVTIAESATDTPTENDNQAENQEPAENKEDTVPEDPNNTEVTDPEQKPDETNPDETNPDETNPDETNPDETNPDETNPDETNPDETNPNEEKPDESDPSEEIPQEPGITETPEEPEEPQEPAKISVVSSAESLSFEKVTEGYENAPEGQIVTLTNNGEADVTLEQPKGQYDYFGIGELSSEVLSVGDSVTFTVQPKTGLTAGTYTDVISVYRKLENEDAEEEKEALASVEVSFEVGEPTVHKLTVSPEELDFGSVTEGYKEAPKAQKITIINGGNATEVLGQPGGADFTVGALSAVELKPGESSTFTVQPKTGLKAGDYLETIQIPNESGTPAAVVAVISVNEKKTDNSVKLTAIQKPAEITGLANGIEKTAQAMKLPATVVIETNKGKMKANVAWDVKGSGYDPKSTSAQTFNVKGTVTLPDGVENPDKISLVTSVKVSVNGYTANVVSADGNKITGITPNGQYTTKSTISFTAVGAGMDNTKPGKGDVRYLPLNWTVVNTNTWTSAPYAASFGMGRSGNYTLSVVFSRQEYDGSNWITKGDQDTKKVSFSVVQAAEQTVTPTPGANQKKAVQTGDDTPIIPFVIALVIAVLCIAGVVVYRKKK